jgi:siroheme synthase-like protein
MSPLAIAISTAGASPALAKRMKREIEAQFGAPYARLAVLLNEARGWAKATLPTYQERKEFFEGIVNGDPDPIALLRDGDGTDDGNEIDDRLAGPAALSGEQAVRDLIARAQDAQALQV